MQFVIFHGSYGSKSGNWFPWLKSELMKLQQNVILEQFPIEDWDEVEKTGPHFIPRKQTLEKWINTFETTVYPQFNKEPKIFIGHSLGPQFILHIVARYNLQLDSAIFVMPFSKLLGENDWMFNVVNDSFMSERFDYQKLQELIPLSYTVYSDNDIVPSDLCISFAHKIKSIPILVKNAKHINAPLFVKMPLVLELCKTRLDPKSYLTVS